MYSSKLFTCIPKYNAHADMHFNALKNMLISRMEWYSAARLAITQYCSLLYNSLSYAGGMRKNCLGIKPNFQDCTFKYFTFPLFCKMHLKFEISYLKS